jgi:hypothetical protein
MCHARRFACMWLGLLALSPYPLVAAVLTVHSDGSGPYPTIQAAVNAAAPADTVELTMGTFFGPGNREID